VVRPCSRKQSPSFTETRQPGRAAGPMPYKPFIYQRPLKLCRCPPSSLVVASALLFRGLEGSPLFISGPTGGRRCLRYGTLLKRGPRVRSSWWSRSGPSSGTPGPGVARELPFKSHFKGVAKFSERIYSALTFVDLRSNIRVSPGSTTRRDSHMKRLTKCIGSVACWCACSEE
jgi:hypothetical protein